MLTRQYPELVIQPRNEYIFDLRSIALYADDARVFITSLVQPLPIASEARQTPDRCALKIKKGSINDLDSNITSSYTRSFKSDGADRHRYCPA